MRDLSLFRWCILFALPGLIICPASVANATVTPQELRCELQSMPLGIDTPQPRLSWSLRSDQRAAAQSRYQVLVASSPAKLGPGLADLWDSGEVKSAETLNIIYAGKPLRSGQRVFWKVRVWEAGDKPSTDSEPTHFEMALLSSEDWQARWITC